MKRYIALLRGINISGKNKVVMAELKKEFESLKFEDVKTYLNSGNVIFSSRENIEKITKQIEEMLKKNYDFKIPVFVLEQEKLKDILEHAPIWWGSDDKMIYDNLIFMIPPVTFKEVFEEIGEAKEGLEKIQNYKDVIFWSFNRKDYQKTNWWPKTANTNVSKKLTIRTANTVRTLRGFLEGYVLLVNHRAFGHPLSIQKSFDFSLNILINGVKNMEGK